MRGYGYIRRRGERSWELKYELGTDPRITKYRSFKGTKRDAQAELVRLMDMVRRGEHVRPSQIALS